MRTINLKDVYCQQCGIYPDGTGDAYGREELINIHCSLWVCANWFLVFNGLSRQKSSSVYDDDDDDDDGARQPEARHFAITLAKSGAGPPPRNPCSNRKLHDSCCCCWCYCCCRWQPEMRSSWSQALPAAGNWQLVTSNTGPLDRSIKATFVLSQRKNKLQKLLHKSQATTTGEKKIFRAGKHFNNATQIAVATAAATAVASSLLLFSTSFSFSLSACSTASSE